MSAGDKFPTLTKNKTASKSNYGIKIWEESRLAYLTPRILAASLFDIGFSNPFSPPLVRVDCKFLKNPGAAAPAGLEALLKIIRTAIAPAATPAAIKAAEA